MKKTETLTLNISSAEMGVLSKMAVEHDLSKTMVLRQALRLYQLVHERMKQGETLTFSGDNQRAVEFVGVGIGRNLPEVHHDTD